MCSTCTQVKSRDLTAIHSPVVGVFPLQISDTPKLHFFRNLADDCLRFSLFANFYLFFFFTDLRPALFCSTWWQVELWSWYIRSIKPSKIGHGQSWLGKRSHFQLSGDEGWEPLATFILGFPLVWQDAHSLPCTSPWKENVKTQPIAQRLAVG